jgi:hypothetical protein
MSKALDLDPRLCTLRGHSHDARKFLDYIFLKQAEMIDDQTESLLLVSVCELLHATVPKISSKTIERFSRVLRTEPSAYCAFFAAVCELEKLPNYNSAEGFLEKFLLKFPGG